MTGKNYKNLLDIIDTNLLSFAELARAAGLSEKTIRNLKQGNHVLRPQTKRSILKGLNKLLKEQDKSPVESDIFN